MQIERLLEFKAFYAEVIKFANSIWDNYCEVHSDQIQKNDYYNWCRFDGDHVVWECASNWRDDRDNIYLELADLLNYTDDNVGSLIAEVVERKWLAEIEKRRLEKESRERKAREQVEYEIRQVHQLAAKHGMKVEHE